MIGPKPRYLELASELHDKVEYLFDLLYSLDLTKQEEENVAIQLGHIVNLAVRCNPRQPQGTVRQRIVGEAMRGRCNVTMTKEVDEKTGRSFNKIHIQKRR